MDKCCDCPTCQRATAVFWGNYDQFFPNNKVNTTAGVYSLLKGCTEEQLDAEYRKHAKLSEHDHIEERHKSAWLYYYSESTRILTIFLASGFCKPVIRNWLYCVDVLLLQRVTQSKLAEDISSHHYNDYFSSLAGN
jgi:hypothetical protein